MAEDDDDLNDFKLPPHSNETADAQLDKKALGMVKEYVASLNRSKNENDTRSNIRENIVKLGINSLSFQHELTAQKMMDASDRRDYMAGRKRMARVFALEDGLFAADQEAVKKRKEKAKEREARAAAKAATKTAEDIERGDPKRGGAGGVNGHAKAKDGTGKKAARGADRGAPAKSPAQAVADRAEDAADHAGRLRVVQDNSPGAEPSTIKDAAAASDAALAESIAAQEQAEGGKLLDDAISGINGQPRSQSEIAREKLEDAKLA